jgi:hypothetical protein
VASRKITPIPYQKLVKVFELDGFTVKRQKGESDPDESKNCWNN